jgi:hypothetical protein
VVDEVEVALDAKAAQAQPSDVPGLREAGYLTNQSVFDFDVLPAALLVLGDG